MKKLLKCIVSLAVVIGCISLVPTDAKDGGRTVEVLDRTGWTGIAFDGDSKEEKPNHNSDGPVSYMLDSNTGNRFHTNYDGGNFATLPVYVFIDLGDAKEFAAFSWKNRDVNDAVKHYKFYINETDQDLIPDDNASSYDGSIENWSLVNESSETNYFKQGATNVVNLNEKVTTKQIMIVVTATYSNDRKTDKDGFQSHVTGEDFFLYPDFQANVPLDRKDWQAYSYNDKNLIEWQRNSNTDGNPNYLLDGNNGTWWHTAWNDNGGVEQTNDTPYYVIIDLQKETEFGGFSWTNRGLGQWANGIVDKYKFYYTNEENLTTPLTQSEGDIAPGWIDGTHLINGFLNDGNGTYSKFGYKTTGDNDIFTTYVSLSEKISARKIMIVALETRNTHASEIHGSGVEFNLYDKVANNKIDLSGGKGSATAYCDAGVTYTGDNALGNTNGGSNDVSVVIDGQYSQYLGFGAANGTDKNNPGSSVYVQIDMKNLYDLEKVVVDLVDSPNRIYNNIVIVASETIEGFENEYDRYVIFNTDTGNKSGMQNDKSFDSVQTNLITAYTKEKVTARYLRVYGNGNSNNKDTHIHEIEVYGNLNSDSSTIATPKHTYLEGYYTDSTYMTKTDTTDSAVKRYVNKDVLGVRAQVKKYEDTGKYAIRFVSSVASLSPKKAGFEVQLNEGTVKEYTTGNAYTVLTQTSNGITTEVDARDVFNNNASDYFFTFKLNNVPESAEGTLKVTPYWIVNGTGEKVRGETVSYDVQELINSIK